jgi:hypothetical protein
MEAISFALLIGLFDRNHFLPATLFVLLFLTGNSGIEA